MSASEVIVEVAEVITPDTRPRHPVEVTVDRITDHVEQYGRHLTPNEVDTLAEAIEALDALRTRLDNLRRRRGES